MGSEGKLAVLEAYVARQSELKRFLTARFRDENTAEDILQEMYLKLERADIKEPIKNPGAFLYRTANNLALDYRKQAMRRATRDKNWSDVSHHSVGDHTVEDVPDPDRAFDARRQLQAVMRSLEELPPQCRKVFKAHKLEGLSYQEVADRMGISKKTVEKHMSKALKFLVQNVKNMDK